MQNKSFLHLIVTRMGIGVRKPEFYDSHIELARLTVARSLDAQTNRNFIWIVAIDSRAPPDVDDRIKALAPNVITEVWRRDPFKVGLTPIDRPSIKNIAQGRRVIVTRIDDDDFLHKTCVELIQNHLAVCSPLTALTFANGAILTSNGVYEQTYMWIAIGLTTLIEYTGENHVYQFNHRLIGDKFEAMGGRVIVVKNPYPMWIRTMRSSSDSAVNSSLRVIKNKKTLSLPLHEYGTDLILMSKLIEILKIDLVVTTSNAGVYGEAAIPKLILKKNLIQKIKNLKKIKDYDENEVEVLSQIMYLI